MKSWTKVCRISVSTVTILIIIINVLHNNNITRVCDRFGRVYNDVRVRTSKAAIAVSAPLGRCAPVATRDVSYVSMEKKSLSRGRILKLILKVMNADRLSQNNNITLAYYIAYIGMPYNACDGGGGGGNSRESGVRSDYNWLDGRTGAY